LLQDANTNHKGKLWEILIVCIYTEDKKDSGATLIALSEMECVKIPQAHRVTKAEKCAVHFKKQEQRSLNISAISKL
jgi:hypothetical protein